MAILQLRIVMNYTRQIINFLRANFILLDIYDSGSDPTRPTQYEEFCNPSSQPDLTRPNPTHRWTRSMSNSAIVLLLDRLLSCQ